MALVNVTTGKSEDLPEEDSLSALAAGTHVPSGGAKALINPSGELVFSPSETAAENVQKYGYKVPTQEQLTEFATQQKYGVGAGNEAKAFGAGFLRGPTFGASDVALGGLGISSPEALRERAARNPIATGAGEVAGIGTSLLALPGGGAVGALGRVGSGIAEAAAPAALAEGAGLAARVVQGAGRVGAKALGSMVEGTVFGLGQTVSEAALGDPALTADKVAANIGYGALIGGGLGGALGLGAEVVPKAAAKAREVIGGLFGKAKGEAPAEIAPGIPAPEVPAAAPEAGTGPRQIRRIQDIQAFGSGKEVPGELPTTPGIIAELGAKITGKTPEEFQEGLTRGATAEVMTPEEREVMGAEMAEGFQKHHDVMDRAALETASLGRQDEMATLLSGADSAPIRAAVERDGAQIAGTLTELETPGLYPPAAGAHLRRVGEALEAAAESDDPMALYKATNDAKRKLYELKSGLLRSASFEHREAGKLVNEVYRAVKSGLEDEAVWGAAGARQAEFNNAFSEFKDAQKEFRKAFMRKTTVKGSDTYLTKATKFNTYVNAINDRLRGAERNGIMNEYLDKSKALLDQIEKTGANTTFENVDAEGLKGIIGKNEADILRARNSIQAAPGGHGALTDWLHPLSAVRHLTKGLSNPELLGMRLASLERAAQRTSNVVSKGAAAIFKPVEKAATKGTGILVDKLSTEEKLKRFEKRTKTLNNFTANPASLLDKVDETTQATYETAPNVTAALQQTAIRGAMFLASKMPRASSPQLPFDKDYQPSPSQVTRFDRYYEAVHDPLTVMAQLKEGRVLPESQEAVAAVYPSLMAEMKQEVTSKLADYKAGDKSHLTYQQKLAIGKFLGAPLSTSATPQAIAANQASHATPTQQQGGSDGVKPSQTGLGKLDLASRTKTQAENVATRT